MAKMPNRNKSKDNPYTLGFDEDKQTFTVEFVDNKKVNGFVVLIQYDMDLLKYLFLPLFLGY